MTSEQILLYAILGIMLIFYIRKQLLARSINNYNGAQAKEQIRAGSILLDVRTANERNSRSLPSSIHIPLQELSSRMKELEKYRGKEIICYCASGSRSVSAGIKLKKAGFTAGNLTGGIGSWNF
ncbi:MAG: rhodanese-like domain-containing protein [Bacteriovoracaceae bacterium]|nr:rhodanese-like domain-containing protein [Bacteroidota bacterium]